MSYECASFTWVAEHFIHKTTPKPLVSIRENEWQDWNDLFLNLIVRLSSLPGFRHSNRFKNQKVKRNHHKKVISLAFLFRKMTKKHGIQCSENLCTTHTKFDIKVKSIRSLLFLVASFDALCRSAWSRYLFSVPFIH